MARTDEKRKKKKEEEVRKEKKDSVVLLKQELCIKIKSLRNLQYFSVSMYLCLPHTIQSAQCIDKPSGAQEVYLVAVGQEAALLYVSHKPPDWYVI